MLVQIQQQEGIVRGPKDEYTPPDGAFIELHLDLAQRVVQVEWHRHWEMRARKTVDWTWCVTIETRL